MICFVHVCVCVCICVCTAIEKYSSDFEKCSGVIKDDMDRKFGAPWNCVVGEFFGFEITHEVKNLLCLYVGGTICVVLWKSQ